MVYGLPPLQAAFDKEVAKWNKDLEDELKKPTDEFNAASGRGMQSFH